MTRDRGGETPDMWAWRHISSSYPGIEPREGPTGEVPLGRSHWGGPTGEVPLGRSHWGGPTGEVPLGRSHWGGPTGEVPLGRSHWGGPTGEVPLGRSHWGGPTGGGPTGGSPTGGGPTGEVRSGDPRLADPGQATRFFRRPCQATSDEDGAVAPAIGSMGDAALERPALAACRWRPMAARPPEPAETVAVSVGEAWLNCRNNNERTLR